MCEAKVYLEQNDTRELIMNDVVTIKPRERSLQLVDLFGEQKSITAAIKEIKLLEHEVVLEPHRGHDV